METTRGEVLHGNTFSKKGSMVFMNNDGICFVNSGGKCLACPLTVVSISNLRLEMLNWLY